MAKKVLSLFLVLLLLSFALVACGDRGEETPNNDPAISGDDPYGDEPEDDGSDSTPGGSAGSEDLSDGSQESESKGTSLGDGTVDEHILATLPQANYAGKVFSVSLPNAEHSYQFDPSGYTGDLEGDAIYRWKKKVQDTFGVKIEHKNWNTNQNADGYYEQAAPEIKNGLSKHNIYGHYAYMISEFIINGCFQDWNALGSQVDEKGTKYLDLSAIRWDQKLNSEVTYNGKLLSLTGDLGVSKLQSAMAMFVNLDLLEEYCGMDSATLYGIVKAGDWTFTTFTGLVEEIYEENTTPGLDTGDILGYYAKSGNSGDIWFPSFNREITARDEVNNTISATFMTDPTNVTIINELRSFFHDSNNVLYPYGDDSKPTEEEKFRNEELGFVTSQFRSVYGRDGFNNMSNFGIVPTPKYSDSQEFYRTKLNDRYTIWGLPTSVKSADRQFTAHITDALCAESSETLYYQYYEVLLKGRYAQDPATAEMVDKVMENPHFDTSIQFWRHIGDYTYLPRNLIVDRSKAIESTYDAAANMLEETLQRIYDCYK